MTTPQLRKSTGRSPWRLGFFLNAFMLVAIALSPTAKAVSPPPDGGYANANTAEGGNALFSLTTGAQNTAIGNLALFNNTTGSFNIALGYKAGENLTTGDNNIDVGSLGGAGDANTVRIGNQVAGTDDVGFPHPAHTATYIAGISGTTVAKSVAVFIDAN